MLGILAKLFGSKSDRDIKKLQPVVELINDEFRRMSSLSDDELRGQTKKIKDIIDLDLSPIDIQIKAEHDKVAANPDLSIDDKEIIFQTIDKLELDRNKELEKVLEKVLPQAFAVVKETARRWKEKGKLSVTATPMDIEIASKKQNVQIIGNKAEWSSKWLAAGTEVTWEMMHFDVQLIGGMVLHSGKISEMATGEGKTLVATLPAYLNALARRGVHIVTVNDYLAKRDSEWMAPLLEFHGMTVDCIDKYQPNSDERKKAYAADITYGTNNEFGFDYLRDNMATNKDDLVQRGYHYAMIDEVDSVLIDDARTPLIISGPVPKGDQHEFAELKPRIQRILEEQKKLINGFLVEAKKYIAAGKEKEAGLELLRAHRAYPGYKPLIKQLSELGAKTILQKAENEYMAENNKRMPEADAPLFFVIDEKHNQVDLTEKGVDFITGEQEDSNLFILPDIGSELAKIEKDKSITDQERMEKTEHLLSEYSMKQERIHTLQQLLKAYTLFEKDTDYVIMDSKVKIVDEQTGRIMDGRRYSDGLHQALEAKENVRVEEATQTYATITLQNYFRMYHKLSGMTGTAETEEAEFHQIYTLDVVVVPSNRPLARLDEQDKVYKTTREKYNAVADEIVELTEKGRPVLVGTTSVDISELLSRMLKMRNIKHQVLNAKLHAKEADVVAEAGMPGTVTIATNMAGRGTDIKLTPESKASGGLAIIGTERHESRRVDRQLRGRAGRQGDPGSSQFFVSLEDNLMRLFGSDRIAKFMDRMGYKEGEVIQHSMISNSIERAQKKVEENNFGQRKRLLEYDNVMNAQRVVIYKRRKNALYGERLKLDILNMIYDLCEDMIFSAHPMKDYDNLKLRAITIFGVIPDLTKEQFEKQPVAVSVKSLYDEVFKHYEQKIAFAKEKTQPTFNDLFLTRGEAIENIVIPFTDGKRSVNVIAPLKELAKKESHTLEQSIERYITLAVIDMHWKDHLREMDELKQSVQNAAYEQKDPLLIYKFEGFELFKKFIYTVNVDIVSFLFKADIPKQDNTVPVREVKQQQVQQPKYKETKDEAGSAFGGGTSTQSEEKQEAPKLEPIRSQKVANRNDKVSVQYVDGSVKRDIKYKSVEEDIVNNKCVLIEE
ncbi:preprotein translocase subunit SecA [uncultured Cytophaga sp.]|uniref:preprotein translocase subunit SecA n=1 Tax=uncultured Cytophaga sp. TaxID=160238 RepID=UPI00262414EC|nr:preprotein translocase subunit SecA [uncultured Cytophaga sp.]